MKHAESLEALLGELTPSNILVVGPMGQSLISDYLKVHPQCRVTAIPANEIASTIDSLQRYDLVFVSHTIENLPSETGVQLIAKLRDLYAKRLILLLRMTDKSSCSYWRKTDLLALGLVQLSENTINNQNIHIYGYDILSYKTNPDWLNSRYWANPELFDKHWW